MFQTNDSCKLPPEMADKIRKTINSTNMFLGRMNGTCVAIEVLRSGQSAPYADHVYEALIVCFIPNRGPANAILPRVIDADEAKVLAKLFVHDFIDNPTAEQWACPILTTIHATDNPCGMVDPPGHKERGMSSCWRVVIKAAYTG